MTYNNLVDTNSSKEPYLGTESLEFYDNQGIMRISKLIEFNAKNVCCRKCRLSNTAILNIIFR